MSLPTYILAPSKQSLFWGSGTASTQTVRPRRCLKLGMWPQYESKQLSDIAEPADTQLSTLHLEDHALKRYRL